MIDKKEQNGARIKVIIQKPNKADNQDRFNDQQDNTEENSLNNETNNKATRLSKLMKRLGLIMKIWGEEIMGMILN